MKIISNNKWLIKIRIFLFAISSCQFFSRNLMKKINQELIQKFASKKPLNFDFSNNDLDMPEMPK